MAPNISCVHGFSTRNGGVSEGNFTSLNLGGSEDSEKNIAENRRIALHALGLRTENLSNLAQVHGNKVNMARCGKQEGDALVGKDKGIVLAVSVADCYPILFQDEENNVIGAAHAGWRGTLSKIAAKTIEEMIRTGARKDKIKVAIGPGISMKNFEVGEEVTKAFLNAGFPSKTCSCDKIDLVGCNRFVLEDCGIPSGNIWSLDRCSFEDDFFSYRRDKGKTGRMWGVISL